MKMAYQDDLIRTIKDSNKWPSFDRPDFLIELNVLADDALSKNTIEGCLAALLIYHQICEEMVRLLLDDSHFFIQLSIFPSEITFPKKNKAMFGQNLDELKSTVSFDGKDNFVKKCDELNALRIEIVHKLTRQSTLQGINSQLAKTRVLFDEIYQLFDVAHDTWRVAFKDLRKGIDWDEYQTEN
jgi:hypothetical protein